MPPGIFQIWDGAAAIVKRLELVPYSDPPRVILTADNPGYQRWERPLSELAVIGGVVVFGSKL